MYHLKYLLSSFFFFFFFNTTEKDWGQGEKAADRGWDGWMASQTQWTWDCANSVRYSRTGKPGVLQLTGSQRVWHDLATEQQQLSTGIRKYSAFEWNLNKFSTEIFILLKMSTSAISSPSQESSTDLFPSPSLKGLCVALHRIPAPRTGQWACAWPHTDSAAEAPRVVVWNSSEEALKSITQWLLGFAKTRSLKCSSRRHRDLKTALATTPPSPSSAPLFRPVAPFFRPDVPLFRSVRLPFRFSTPSRTRRPPSLWPAASRFLC